MPAYVNTASETASQYAKITRFVNRLLLDKLTLKTALRSTAYLDSLQKNVVRKNGQRFELPVRRALSGTTKMVSIYDNNTDFIGDSPYSTPGTNTAVNTFTEKDSVRNMEVQWAFMHDNIRFNKVHLQWAASEGKFMDYFVENMDYLKDSLEQFAAGQILDGTGRGTGQTQMYGRYQQVASWSGDRAANSGQGTNADTTNTHFGLPRHQFPNMVGNVWRADAVHDANGNGEGDGVDVVRYLGSSGQVLILASTALEFTGAVYQNNETDVDLAGADVLPLTLDCDEFYVWITVDDGTSALDGQTFKRVIGCGGAGAGGFQIAQVIHDTTLADSADITVDVVIRPKYNYDVEGEAGQFTVNKMHKAYTHDGAMDGRDYVDMLSINSNRFYSFMIALQQLQRWYGEDPYLLSEGYHNFMFNAARTTIDNFEDEDAVRGDNTKHTKLYLLRGFDKFQLDEDGMYLDTTGRRIKSIVGDVLWAGQCVGRSPNRDIRVIGFDTRPLFRATPPAEPV